MSKLKAVRDSLVPLPAHPARPTHIRDRRLVEHFDAEPSNPYLVSFPRTGSPWLQMLMERYFERPSLHMVYFYPERLDYMLRHVHDLEFDEERESVLYLYRDPVDTVFAQLYYCGAPLDSPEHIGRWTKLYAAHVEKWLCTEQFTKRKTVIRYEALHDDLPGEFSKVCAHFGVALDQKRLFRTVSQTKRWVLKQKTSGQVRLADLAMTYGAKRNEFRAHHGGWVWKQLLDGRPHLYRHFEQILHHHAA